MACISYSEDQFFTFIYSAKTNFFEKKRTPRKIIFVDFWICCSLFYSSKEGGNFLYEAWSMDTDVKR